MNHSAWYLCPWDLVTEGRERSRFNTMYRHVRTQPHASGSYWQSQDLTYDYALVKLYGPPQLHADVRQDQDIRPIRADHLTGPLVPLRTRLDRAVTGPPPKPWINLWFGTGFRPPFGWERDQEQRDRKRYQAIVDARIAGHGLVELFEAGLIPPFAGGAFPTTSIIDAFNRANENPLSDGGKWSAGIFTTNPLQVFTNVCTGTGDVLSDGYRNDQDYGPDSEGFFSSGGSQGGLNNFGVGARFINIGTTTTDGYHNVFIISGTIMRIRRVDNAVVTTLGADITQGMDQDDDLGIEIIGDQISLYFNNDGAGWSSLGVRTDATYSAAGKLGITMNGTSDISNSLDDFGGGTIVASLTTEYVPSLWAGGAMIGRRYI